MVTQIRLSFVALASLALAFFGVTLAFASVAAVSPDQSAILDLLRPVVQAVQHGELALAGALGIIFAVAMTRRYLPDGYGGKWVRGDMGGMLTAFLYSAAGSVATTLADSSAHFTSSVALAALKFGMGAVGGFVALHKLATALTATRWWNEKAPAWLRTGLAFMLALIGSSAAEKAEAAGKTAVEAKPSTGSGEFTDVS
jgi:hypothetical protein